MLDRDTVIPCTTTTSHSMISVKESGRCFRIKNPSGDIIGKIVVDGCVIRDGRQRCDYVFEIGNPCRCVLYVELKGADLCKAFSQLNDTLGYFAQLHVSYKKICHIVASRVPKIAPKIQVMKAKMAKYHHASLFLGTCTVCIDLDKSPYKCTEI